MATRKNQNEQKTSGIMEYDTFNPSPEMLERGRRFGGWFRRAIKESPYDNVAQLAPAMGVSRQTLYPYFDDCIAGDGRFRKPSEQMIKRIADATTANYKNGLRAAGYETDDLPVAPDVITDLPSDAQEVLAKFVQLLQLPTGSTSRIMRELEPDAMKVLAAYEGVPASRREEAVSYLESLRATEDKYRKRTDIVGKRADSDDYEQVSINEE